MDHLARVSEALYVGLCRYECIGTPTEVTIRRVSFDVDEGIKRPLQICSGTIYMKSGSYREGFRFKSSDVDTMIWHTNTHMIFKSSEAVSCNFSRLNIILMEHSETPPGFVRLTKLLHSERLEQRLPLVVIHGQKLSSEETRKYYHQFLKSTHNRTERLRAHGPCSNYHMGHMEFDRGWCVACHYWPPAASSWIDRCQQKGLPTASVLDEIVSNGCHVMSVGSKIESDESEFEWRLSFSEAELNIVYSMNHTQFLCYGALKIFLKEVLSSENQESLICSYFMKTIIFWEIQNNPGSIFWCPSNLMSCFWMCFKRLCKCVLDSNCPNFFIPQNNMFQNKVVSAPREALLSQLYDYYEIGLACLLLSPTIGSSIAPVLSNPLYVIPFSMGHVISLVQVDECIRKEFFQMHYIIDSIEKSFVLLKSIFKLSELPLTQFQKVRLQYSSAKVLVQTAFFLVNHVSCKTNKILYILDRKIINMLNLFAKIGPLPQLLYLGVHYYSTGRYSKALRIAKICKNRLSDPFAIYNDIVDKHRYVRYFGKLPLGERMKKSYIDFVLFNHNIIFRTDFFLEQCICQGKGMDFLLIPPFVLVHMLSVLCNYRLGNRSQCLQSLTDLQTLLFNDDKTYVPLFLRDISWQILGICQHVVGDLHGALQSYQMSLRQEPFHKIQRATIYRLTLALYQLVRN